MEKLEKQRIEDYKKDRLRITGQQDDKQNKQKIDSQINPTNTYEELIKTGITSADPTTLNKILNDANLKPISVSDLINSANQISDDDDAIKKKIEEYMRIKQVLADANRDSKHMNSNTT
jgi:Holliday junction resolvasome RuvABC ATP-dependent DNA helicase subunit